MIRKLSHAALCCVVAAVLVTAHSQVFAQAPENALPPAPQQVETGASDGGDTAATPPAHPANYGPILRSDGLRVHADLARLESELEGLREQRRAAGLGGPVAVIAVGAGAALVVAAYIGYLSLSIWANSTDGYSSPAERRQRRTAAWYTLPGVAVAMGGGVWLGLRLRTRHNLGREIHALERAAKRLELGIAPQANASGGGLTLMGRF